MSQNNGEARTVGYSPVRRPDFINLHPVERSRTYHFPGGDKVEFKGVHKMRVSPVGTHYLETSDGQKHIVPKGFLWITIDVDEWTF